MLIFTELPKRFSSVVYEFHHDASEVNNKGQMKEL